MSEAYRKHHADFIESDTYLRILAGPEQPEQVEALVASALRFTDRPNYRGLICTRHVVAVADEFVRQSQASEWSKGKRAVMFESGALIWVGRFNTIEDAYKMAGCEFNFVGIHGADKTSDDVAAYLASRLRCLADDPAGVRLRKTYSLSAGELRRGMADERFDMLLLKEGTSCSVGGCGEDLNYGDLLWMRKRSGAGSELVCRACAKRVLLPIHEACDVAERWQLYLDAA